MRLIDADIYAAEMRKKQDNCRTWKDSLDEGTELYARAEQSFVTFVEAALTLKNQPTINAIPVEWLEEHDGENISDSDGNIYGRRYITISEALSMWQKEQEAR